MAESIGNTDSRDLTTPYVAKCISSACHILFDMKLLLKTMTLVGRWYHFYFHIVFLLLKLNCIFFFNYRSGVFLVLCLLD